MNNRSQGGRNNFSLEYSKFKDKYIFSTAGEWKDETIFTSGFPVLLSYCLFRFLVIFRLNPGGKKVIKKERTSKDRSLSTFQFIGCFIAHLSGVFCCGSATIGLGNTVTSKR